MLAVGVAQGGFPSKELNELLETLRGRSRAATDDVLLTGRSGGSSWKEVRARSGAGRTQASPVVSGTPGYVSAKR
jgi:hypothetical protein